MARHRAEYNLLRYPVGAYIVWAKNRWYGFIKPQLRQSMRRGK